MDKTVTKMTVLAPSTMRRLMQNSAQTKGSRTLFTFAYPHSFSGTNNAFNNKPVKQVDADRNLKVGDEAPLAQQDLR